MPPMIAITQQVVKTVSTGKQEESVVDKTLIVQLPTKVVLTKLPIETPTIGETIQLPIGNSWVRVVKPLPIDIQVNSALFEKLWKLHPEERHTIMIYGKARQTPRWQQSYGKSYKYSGTTNVALPITEPYFQKLLNWVCEDSGLPYQQILVNWYQDGQHYIGAHSDDEKQLVPNSGIYSFSFGQERIFRVRNKKTKKIFRDFPVTDNSLLVMGGEMQKYYTHEVPKRAISTVPGQRINITFRLFAKTE